MLVLFITDAESVRQSNTFARATLRHPSGRFYTLFIRSVIKH